MLRSLLLTFALILTAQLLVFSQSGALQGKVTDKDTKEPVPFANIIVESGGRMVSGGTTDFDGKYVIKPLTPGRYDVKASFVGYKTRQINGVVVGADQIEFLNIELSVTAETLETVEVVDYKVPLISKDKTTSGATVTSEEIAKMPNRSASAVATTVGGVYADADGGNISIRGQRSDGTVTYIDGIRVSAGSSSLPQSAIEQVSVVLGGVPARYGDATGGIINVTTKGPSRQFGGGVELETSEFLDNFGHNRVGLSLQGPLIKKKEGNSFTSLLGYFIAGDFTYNRDGRPAAPGTIFKAKDDVIDFLKENPQRLSGSGYGVYPNSAFLRASDFEEVQSSLNTDNTDITLSGKLDIRTAPTINLSVGGSYNYDDSRNFSIGNSLLNWDKNSHSQNMTWRVFGRFTQRFPVDKDSKSVLKNVFYTIQADYSKYKGMYEDADHGDKIFNYGYLGKYTTYKTRSYELGSDTVNGKLYSDVWIHNGFRDTLVAFEKFNLNPFVANYTRQYYELYPEAFGNHQNFDQIMLGGAYVNGMAPETVYGLYNNVGTQFNGYGKSEADQFSISAEASADIGKHAFQIGFQYEQRSDRGWNVGPVGLWTLMRGLTNFHIQQLDFEKAHLVTIDNVFQDTIWYDRKYDALTQRVFDLNLRQRLGLPIDGVDWIDIDSYDPVNYTIKYFDNSGIQHEVKLDKDIYSLDLFSPDELLNDGSSYIGYYGYDYLGNKLTTRPSFEDFFTKTKKDALGREYFTREIAAFEPIYMAGYIQDKFAFDDLIFNIGVRVDRFDANQKVLADPYLFYPAKTVEEVSSLGGVAVNHPDNIGSDYVVYVDNKLNPTKITGYRFESTWYNADGTVVTDPGVLDAGGGITPYLIDPAQQEVQPNAFTDYDPQISVMPRIAFSFPISDEALFFAHYDILTQRPTEALRGDPSDYYFIDKRGTISNPNLKPTKTIDYELGFQQRLGTTSSLKLSAFYREMRDQIQYYRYTGAYTGGSNLYYSYNNIDFGTVKGLTISYDLRRTTNVRLRASYTLQFADGTGSSSSTAAALVNAGYPNLRTIFPLNWDRRHALNVVLDYRFGGGTEYNGPVTSRKVKGTDQVKSIRWLENFGFNVTVGGGSGTPYTKSSNIVGTYAGGGSPLLEGQINGSRLPWEFRIDARVDKDFSLGSKPNSPYVNIYLQVLNLFDTKNVKYVYPATGSPSDDGYLSAPEWQEKINSNYDPQSYRDLYTIRMNSPGNYSLPRYIRLGLTLNF